MLKELSQDLEKIADIMDQQFKIAEQNKTVEQNKTAGLFAVGDSIVCLNPIEGIVKGQKYRITRFTNPNYAAIEDVYGNEIGSFRLDRFCKDNNEY